MKIALCVPNNTAWLGPARSQLFQSHLEDMGHRVVVIPATGKIPDELGQFDVVMNHAISLPADLARKFAERNPKICFINMNHSSMSFLEYTSRLMRQFTSTIWGAKSLKNFWLVNQDDNGIGEAIGCDRVTRLQTPVHDIKPRHPREVPSTVRIVITGRPCPIKNFYNQLIAVKSLKRPYELHLCNEPSKEMEYLMKALDLRAVGHGMMPHGKWIRFLKSTADIVLQVGLTESYNYVATEAQLCGVPVIAGESVAARDPAITVKDPNRVEQIVSAIEHTIETYGERQKQAVIHGQQSREDQNKAYRDMFTHIIDSHNQQTSH